MALHVSFGTMTFGWDKSSRELGQDTAAEMMDIFAKAGHRELDTALLYSEGNSEKMIGSIIKDGREQVGFEVATKANAYASNSIRALSSGLITNAGGYSDEKLKKQVQESLDSLQAQKVAILYLHMPDHQTPIADTLKSLNDLHVAGKFDELGLSNYAAWEVVHIWHLCDRNGWVKPTVYQGLYNAVTRNLEDELIVACHQLGIRLRVYNPLAGGMLTGKHNGLAGTSEVPKGRFQDNPMYMSRYWKPSFFSSMDLVKAACDKHGISMTHCAFRWLTSHSKLSKAHNDGVIIGASSIEQLRDNIEGAGSTEPLPSDVLAALDTAWAMVKGESPVYHRGYSNMNQPKH